MTGLLRHKGSIAWMANNPVAANLLMAIFLLGGLAFFTQIRQEVFPDMEDNVVSVNVAYPGAAPEEVEQGICRVTEEAIRSLDGVKEVTSTAGQGSGSIRAELMLDANPMKVYQDIQSEVDRITTYPKDAEEPQVSLSVHRREVISLVLYGNIPESSLCELAEQVRDRLLQNPSITQIDLSGVRNREIRIEVPQEELRRYNLTHRQIAAAVANEAVELSGGGIKTRSGETLLRMKERRDYGQEFARVPVAASEDGTQVRLEDLGTVIDGFEDSDHFALYNGKPSVMLEIYRVGEQTPADISRAVSTMLPMLREQLPSGVEVNVLSDRTEVFFQRADLLLRNGAQGLILVMLLLGIFLELRVAFWVMMGIPVSILGSMLLMPAMDLTINMITMFAYLITLGIVVDDAIVVGENIYHYQQEGLPPVDAAIKGTREVCSPVAFSILTNIVAFIPLIYLPGNMGKIMGMLPLVVITVFTISWLESLYILPAHLSHGRIRTRHGVKAWIHNRQQRISVAFTRWVRTKYGPFLDWCLHHRYLVVAASLALLIVVGGYWKSGRLGFSMFPTVESDHAQVNAALPFGMPIEKTKVVSDRLVRAAQEVIDECGHPELSEGIFADIGSGGSNKIEVRVFLADPEIRNKIMSTEEFMKRWREKAGDILGVRTIRYSSDSGGPGGGAALTIELRHENVAVLEAAAAKLAKDLAAFPLAQDIDDGVEEGKRQYDFTMKPAASSLGLTAESVGRQVRSAFEGVDVLRQQRGRNEVRVKVRLPEDERTRMYNLENFILRTPSGGEVPLVEVVDTEMGRSYTSISRRNGLRTRNVTADIRPKSKAGEVMAQLDVSVLPALMDQFPGLDYSYEGQQADKRESLGSMQLTLPLVLLSIYILLAIPFRSYIQPLIVMTSIPFGIIGAVLGHILMGYEMTMIGIIGMLALSGVVVNDALVLIDFANSRRAHHDTAHDAVVAAGIQRFRPIMLTTLTTFGGLAPMIFETSRQAKFLIPMAISLGYGLLFATAITLVLVPSLYMIVEDVKNLRKQ